MASRRASRPPTHVDLRTLDWVGPPLLVGALLLIAASAVDAFTGHHDRPPGPTYALAAVAGIALTSALVFVDSRLSPRAHPYMAVQLYRPACVGVAIILCAVLPVNFIVALCGFGAGFFGVASVIIATDLIRVRRWRAEPHPPPRARPGSRRRRSRRSGR